jgi:hypothetical protein
MIPSGRGWIRLLPYQCWIGNWSIESGLGCARFARVGLDLEPCCFHLKTLEAWWTLGTREPLLAKAHRHSAVGKNDNSINNNIIYIKSQRVVHVRACLALWPIPMTTRAKKALLNSYPSSHHQSYRHLRWDQHLPSHLLSSTISTLLRRSRTAAPGFKLLKWLFPGEANKIQLLNFSVSTTICGHCPAAKWSHEVTAG